LPEKLAIDFMEGEIRAKSRLVDTQRLRNIFKKPTVTEKFDRPINIPFDEPRSLNIVTTKITSQSASRHIKFLSDLVKSPAIIKKKRFGFFCVERHRFMMESMRAALKDSEIFKSIVTFIRVNVMNNFIGKQLSTQDILYQPSVARDNFTSNRNARILSSMLEAIIGTAAVDIAKYSLITKTRRTVKGFTTSQTSNKILNKIMGMFRHKENDTIYVKTMQAKQRKVA
jgi:hypothetical protein